MSRWALNPLVAILSPGGTPAASRVASISHVYAGRLPSAGVPSRISTSSGPYLPVPACEVRSVPPLLSTRYTSLGQKETELTSTRSKVASAKGRHRCSHPPCGCGPRESWQPASSQLTFTPRGPSALRAPATLGG